MGPVLDANSPDLLDSWCPVCAREIVPKRFVVPVHSVALPPAPPSTPQLSPSRSSNIARRNKSALKQKSGFVQGTGRLKPNGTIKRSYASQSDSPPAVAPLRHRMVIDSGPIPLYCSDECRLADISSTQVTLPHNYHPDRQYLASSPVSQFPDRGSEIESDSTDSSVDSQSSSTSSAPDTYKSPSLARLAAVYNFPPLPPLPPAPVLSPETCPSDAYPSEYTSGIIMAGRYIQSMCPKSLPPQIGAYRRIPEPAKPIPGWTDGSNAWRSSVYSFANPKNQQNPQGEDATAYRSCVASPHRSHSSVQSSVGESSTITQHSAHCSPNESNEMIAKFSASFNRRSELRSTVRCGTVSSSASTDPLSTTGSWRERSLVEPGAEGKLLVPDVKLKVRCGSSSSLSSGWSGPRTASSRRSVRSPLSVFSDIDEGHDPLSVPLMSRPRIAETRSWSYDNLKTYPIMQLPPKMETRVERQMVDGEMKDVEVHVAVQTKMQRLFLFPPTIRRI